MGAAEFRDPQGDLMVPMRCGSCGDEVGLVSPTWDYQSDPNIIVRCYACAATEEAEAITGESA